MKLFRKNNILFKLIITLCISFSCFGGIINTSVVQADAYDLAGEAAMQGGKLIEPIVSLMMTLGDGAMDLIQKAIVGTKATGTINFATQLISVIIGIVAAIAVIAAITILTGGIGGLVAGIGGALGSVLTAVGGSGVVTFLITAGTLAAALASYNFATDAFEAAFLPDITVFPMYSISPEEVFEGRLLIFDINFFNPKTLKVHLKSSGKDDFSKDKEIQDYDEKTDGEASYYYYEDGDEKVVTSKQSTAIALGKTISKWYYNIRNIAVVIMMLILMYIGIRMMLCSIASEKSKYKKMLSDWVISMCLVFVLHYIMVFAVNVNESIIKLITTATDKEKYVVALTNVKDKDNFVSAIEKDDKYNLKQFLCDADGNAVYDEDTGKKITGSGDATQFIYPTNLVGRMRLDAQMQDGTSEYIGYAIAFIILVMYTCFFVFTYLKRVIYMAFLTVIAPLVAMTYSLDKISDGKAQAFNMWLKEYIGNLLIQPVHLLLYMILISMAFDLASQNIVYTLVAMGFLMPAEKLIRSMFGLDKAKTPGFLGGATGAALAMNTMQSLSRFAGKGPGSKGNKPMKMAKNESEDDPKGIYDRGADSGHGIAALYDGYNNEEGTDDGSSSDNDQTNGQPQQTVGRNTNYLGSGGSSATDAGLNLKDGEDPVAKMEREALEEKLADGQLTENELTDKQRELLGMERRLSPDAIMERESLEEKLADGQLTQSDLTDEQRQLLGISGSGTQPPSVDNQVRISPDRMLEESKNVAEARRKEAIMAKGKRTVKQRLKDGANGAKDSIKLKNIGEAIGKTGKNGLKLAGATIGAGFGIAAGAATGDFNNVVKNAGLGLSAGNSIGTGIGNGIENGINNGVGNYKKAKEASEKEIYGKDYNQYKKYKTDEKFVKDKDARKEFRQAFSDEFEGLSSQEKKEKLDSIMQSAIKYRQEGVTDNKLIIKAMNLDKNNKNSKDSIAAAVMANKAKDRESIDRYQKDLEKVVKPEKAQKITDNAKKIGGYSI